MKFFVFCCLLSTTISSSGSGKNDVTEFFDVLSPDRTLNLTFVLKHGSRFQNLIEQWLTDGGGSIHSSHDNALIVEIPLLRAATLLQVNFSSFIDNSGNAVAGIERGITIPLEVRPLVSNILGIASLNSTTDEVGWLHFSFAFLVISVSTIFVYKRLCVVRKKSSNAPLPKPPASRTIAPKKHVKQPPKSTKPSKRDAVDKEAEKLRIEKDRRDRQRQLLQEEHAKRSRQERDRAEMQIRRSQEEAKKQEDAAREQIEKDRKAKASKTTVKRSQGNRRRPSPPSEPETEILIPKENTTQSWFDMMEEDEDWSEEVLVPACSLQPSSGSEHSLETPWSIWMYGSEVGTFDSVEGFWRYWNFISVEQMRCCDIRLFRQGIRPVPEDEHNSGGGFWWTHLYESKERKTLWSNIVLAVIGEQLQNEGYSVTVCGVVLCADEAGDLIQLWLGSPSQEYVWDQSKASMLTVSKFHELILHSDPSVQFMYQLHFPAVYSQQKTVAHTHDPYALPQWTYSQPVF